MYVQVRDVLWRLVVKDLVHEQTLVRDRQTDRQTDTGRQTDTDRHRQIDRQTDKRDGQRQTDRQRRERDRGRETNRQRQTDRQTDRDRGRETERKMLTYSGVAASSRLTLSAACCKKYTRNTIRLALAKPSIATTEVRAYNSVRRLK